MNADDLQRVRDHYDNHCVADEIADAELVYIDPRDPEYQEFARFCNAVSRAIVDDAAANNDRRIPFSTRRRIAGRAWKELHPNSKYGYGTPGEPK